MRRQHGADRDLVFLAPRVRSPLPASYTKALMPGVDAEHPAAYTVRIPSLGPLWVIPEQRNSPAFGPASFLMWCVPDESGTRGNNPEMAPALSKAVRLHSAAGCHRGAALRQSATTSYRESRQRMYMCEPCRMTCPPKNVAALCDVETVAVQLPPPPVPATVSV